MELIVIDLERTEGNSYVVHNDDGELLDHLRQYPDNYVAWQRFEIKAQ